MHVMHQSAICTDFTDLAWWDRPEDEDEDHDHQPIQTDYKPLYKPCDFINPEAVKRQSSCL